MRCFIALPVPEPEKKLIHGDSEPVRARYDTDERTRISWVRPEGMHITLAFLGEIPATEAGRIAERLEAGGLHRTRVFTIRYEGLMQFPARGMPRVLITPVTQGAEQCIELEKSLRSLLNGLWVPDKKSFVPHITLGRVKRMERPPVSGDEASALQGEFTADRITLYESILGKAGASYRTLSSVMFETGRSA